MFYIYTQNKHNQILIFYNYNEAVSWCKLATRWTDDEIKRNIKTPTPRAAGNYKCIFE